MVDGPATRAGTARFPIAGRHGRDILRLADLGGQIAGFASGTVLSHTDKAPPFFSQGVGVHDNARRRGIGRAPVLALRDEGRMPGCTASWIRTQGHNPVARALSAGTGGKATSAVAMVERALDGDGISGGMVP